MPISVYPSSAATKSDIAELQYQLQSMSAGAYPGEVRQFNTETGLPPDGWSLASGIVPNITPYASLRWIALTWINAVPPAAWAGSKIIGSYSTSTRVYDIALGAETVLTNFPLTNHIPRNVLMTDEVIYSFGSSNGTTYSSSSYRYRLNGTVWEAIATPPGPAAMLRMRARLADGKFLLVGGSTASNVIATTVLNSVEIYDPALNTYQTKASLPLRLAGGKVLHVSEDEYLLLPFYVSDGTTVTGGSKRAFIYKVSTGALIELDSCPFAASSASIVFLRQDGKPVCASGGGSGYVLDRTAQPGAQWMPHSVAFPAVGGSASSPTTDYEGTYFAPMNGGVIPAAVTGTSTSTMLFQTQFNQSTSATSIIGVKNK